MVSIYALIDPRDARIRYVGKTKHELWHRRMLHVAEARSENQTHKARWIRQLLADGVRPRPVLIERAPESGWQERERHWIATLRNAGHRLTNIARGGEGGSRPMSEETKRKISASRIGNKYALGTVRSEEFKRKVSAAQTGVPKPRTVPDSVIKTVREEYATGRIQQKEIAKRHGLSTGFTSRVIRGRHRPEAGGPIYTGPKLKKYPA